MLSIPRAAAARVEGGSEFMADFEHACEKLGIPLHVLPPTRPKRSAQAAPHQKIARALAIVHDTNASTRTKLAFRFLVLTATRSGEVRGATWDEIDLAHGVWSIPPDTHEGRY